VFSYTSRLLTKYSMILTQ